MNKSKFIDKRGLKCATYLWYNQENDGLNQPAEGISSDSYHIFAKTVDELVFEKSDVYGITLSIWLGNGSSFYFWR